MSQSWTKVTVLLYAYGFFREFRPSEPFSADYLSGEWRNITAEQVTKEVYPYATYSHLSQLIIVFILADILKYKPLIVVSACFGILIPIMLLWTTSLRALKTVEVFYGTFMATEVAYYTYINAKVEREDNLPVRGITKAVVLCSRFLAGIVAQLLVSFQIMDLRQLNYVSLGSQIISLVCAIILPSVGSSTYFNPPSDFTPRLTNKNIDIRRFSRKVTNSVFSRNGVDWEKFGRVCRLLWNYLTISYTNPFVIQWSLWWALGMCGFMQVQLNIQLLWQQINPKHENNFNGAAEALLTLFGTLAMYVAGCKVAKKFDRWDLWILTLCSAIEGGILIWCASTDSVWISYIAYILFGTTFYFMITFTSMNVAKNLLEDSIPLIFAINTMFALMLQSILNVAVISEIGFELKPREQYVVYGGYFIAVAVICGIRTIVSSFMKCDRPNR